MTETFNRNSSKQHKKFPKENEQKKNELIQQLKDQVKHLKKRIKILETQALLQEKSPKEAKSKSLDEFRKDFVKKYKRTNKK